MIERAAPLRPGLARRAKEVRGERRCMRITRSYATSDWNRGSVSSSTLTEICAGYDPLARRKERRAGIRKRIGHQPRLEHIVASCRDPYAVLRMLHPTLLLNGSRFFVGRNTPISAEFSQLPANIDFFLRLRVKLEVSDRK